VSAQANPAGHILIAEDEAPLAGMLAQHLAALGHRVTSVSDGAAALRALHAEAFDVALLDIMMPAADGLELLRALSEDYDPPAVIVATSQGTIDTAVQAMRLGAFAYLAKPYRVAELDVVISRALETRKIANENATLRAQLARADGAPEFITRFAPLRAVHAAALAAAGREMPVLIIGAPGTGKCSLARAMHARSSRAARPFVQLDAAALATPDAERTLFGVEPAGGGPRTRAALAGRGTLYLHDVTVMNARAQARLARALREQRFRAVGAADERSVRARLIAASPGPLNTPGLRVHPELVAELSATHIVLPSLRERAVDIPALAEAFLAAAGDATTLRIDPDALAALEAYSWPGNVAELRAVVERARLRAQGGVIRVTDLSLTADDELELSEVERRHIVSVLEARAWHQGRAAQSLGISPKTLYRKMREFGLRRPSRTRK
jgi:DNA-binding NtrC family response regulator